MQRSFWILFWGVLAIPFAARYSLEAMHEMDRGRFLTAAEVRSVARGGESTPCNSSVQHVPCNKTFCSDISTEPNCYLTCTSCNGTGSDDYCSKEVHPLTVLDCTENVNGEPAGCGKHFDNAVCTWYPSGDPDGICLCDGKGGNDDCLRNTITNSPKSCKKVN